jgi:hypothetical protein
MKMWTHRIDGGRIVAKEITSPPFEYKMPENGYYQIVGEAILPDGHNMNMCQTVAAEKGDTFFLEDPNSEENRSPTRYTKFKGPIYNIEKIVEETTYFKMPLKRLKAEDSSIGKVPVNFSISQYATESREVSRHKLGLISSMIYSLTKLLGFKDD